MSPLPGCVPLSLSARLVQAQAPTHPSLGQHRHCTYTWHKLRDLLIFIPKLSHGNKLPQVCIMWDLTGQLRVTQRTLQRAALPAWCPSPRAFLRWKMNVWGSSLAEANILHILSTFSTEPDKENERNIESFPWRSLPRYLVSYQPGKPCGLRFVLLRGMKKLLWQNGEFNNR